MSKLLFIFIGVVISLNSFSQKETGSIPVSFEAISKGEDGVMNRTLVNDFGENYSITKLKFYVSNIKFETDEVSKTVSSVFLIDASKQNAITLSFGRISVSKNSKMGLWVTLAQATYLFSLVI